MKSRKQTRVILLDQVWPVDMLVGKEEGRKEGKGTPKMGKQDKKSTNDQTKLTHSTKKILTASIFAKLIEMRFRGKNVKISTMTTRTFLTCACLDLGDDDNSSGGSVK